ncbi:hypothetical protein GEV33_012643 [Tenebrio molitor]|uniref:Uncharacterized protein n=1 Tax=Tenebrio molitor TaxID=7067 RepID=A0A8J6H8V4_TENMO|nr:hypothetical protein GEV33_012643 [Tenebrio molitor]
MKFLLDKLGSFGQSELIKLTEVGGSFSFRRKQTPSPSSESRGVLAAPPRRKLSRGHRGPHQVCNPLCHRPLGLVTSLPSCRR